MGVAKVKLSLAQYVYTQVSAKVIFLLAVFKKCKSLKKWAVDLGQALFSFRVSHGNMVCQTKRE